MQSTTHSLCCSSECCSPVVSRGRCYIQTVGCASSQETLQLNCVNERRLGLPAKLAAPGLSSYSAIPPQPRWPIIHRSRLSCSLSASVLFVFVLFFFVSCLCPVVLCISLQFSNVTRQSLVSPFFVFGVTEFSLTGELVRAIPEDGCSPLAKSDTPDNYFAGKIVWMEALHCSIESKIFNCQHAQCLAIISSSIYRVPGNEMWTQWDINMNPDGTAESKNVIKKMINIPFVHVGRQDADLIRQLLIAKDEAQAAKSASVPLLNLSAVAEEAGLTVPSTNTNNYVWVAATLFSSSVESINQWDDIFTSFNFLFLFQVLLTFIHGFSFTVATNKWLSYYRKSTGQSEHSLLSKDRMKQHEKAKRRVLLHRQRRPAACPQIPVCALNDQALEMVDVTLAMREQSVAKNEKEKDEEQEPEQLMLENETDERQMDNDIQYMAVSDGCRNLNKRNELIDTQNDECVKVEIVETKHNAAESNTLVITPGEQLRTETEMIEDHFPAFANHSSAAQWTDSTHSTSQALPASAHSTAKLSSVAAKANGDALVVEEKLHAIMMSNGGQTDESDAASRLSTVNTRKALIRPKRCNSSPRRLNEEVAADEEASKKNPRAALVGPARTLPVGRSAVSASSPPLGTSFSYIPLVILSLEMFAMFERALYCCLDPLGARHFIPYSFRRFLLTLSIPFTFSANLLLIFFWYETLARYGELTMQMMKNKYKKTKSTLQQWGANPNCTRQQTSLVGDDDDETQDSPNLNLFPSSPSSIQFLTHFRLPFFCTCVTLFLLDFTFALLDVLYVSDLVFLPVVELVYSFCSLIFLASLVYVSIYLFHHFHFSAEKEKSYLKFLCVTSEKEQQEIFEANRKAAFEKIFSSSPIASDQLKEAAKENLFRELTLLNLQQMRNFALTVENAVRNQMRKIDANKEKKMRRLKSFLAFVGLGMVAFMIGNSLSPFLLDWMDSPVLTVARQWIIFVAMWMLGTAHILCF